MKSDMKFFIDTKKELDPDGMYEDIVAFPEHMKDGKQIADSAKLPSLPIDEIRQIVVCGMGGSAIGGDLVRAYLGKDLQIPMVICRHYEVPPWVGKYTLVIGSSYSGNTEETLSAISSAADRGARVICITTGGKLKEMAGDNNWPVVTIPKGMMPRAALAYSFIPLLVTMSRFGFVKDCDREIPGAIEDAKKRATAYSLESGDNAAVKLARRVHGRIPIIYAGPDFIDAVGVRFKGQICENSKQLAFVNVYPEFNHNELVGWEIYEPFAKKLIVITLRDDNNHKRVDARMDIVNRWLAERDIEHFDMTSDGDSLLSRMISLIQYGDFTSWYLAMLNGADPSPVRVIDYLKGELDKV